MLARFEAHAATEPPLAFSVPGAEHARFVRWCAKDLAQSIARADAENQGVRAETEHGS
jgi:hypothetical protein